MTTFNQAQYDDLVVKSKNVYAHTKYDILERYLADRPAMRILNVGRGSGDLSIRLAQLGHNVSGIDVEPAYIRLAKDNAGRTATRGPCSFAVCSIEDYQSEGRFDCLVSTDVLEHIVDDRRAFAKMVDLLYPGGLLLITVPAGPWLFGYHDEQLGHYRRYTKSTLRQLAGNSAQSNGYAISASPSCPSGTSTVAAGAIRIPWPSRGTPPKARRSR